MRITGHDFLSLCCGALLLAACGDDVLPGTDEDSTGGAGTTDDDDGNVTITSETSADGSTGTDGGDSTGTDDGTTGTDSGAEDTASTGDTTGDGSTSDTEGTEDSDTEDSDTEDTDGTALLPCADVDMGSTVPNTVGGQTLGAGNDFTGPETCTSGDDEDIVFQFTAPQAGVYLFQTAASDFDTILYFLESCEGEGLRCSDDLASGDTTSAAVFELELDQTILVVVDGWDETGTVSLTVEVGEAPVGDYNDCENQTDMLVCQFDERCEILDDGGVCAQNPCQSDDECPAGGSGTAVPVCFDLYEEEVDRCFLDCSQGTCPNGMICDEIEDLCVWTPER